MALADVDGDAHPDVVTALHGSVEVLLGQADGGFVPATASTTLSSVPTAVASADFDGDGRADIVLAQSGFSTRPLLSLWLGNGDGTFRHQESHSVSSPLTLLAVAMWGADGGMGVIGVDAVGDAFIFTGDGHGHLTGPNIAAVPASANGMTLGDFTQPGVTDALISAPSDMAIVPDLASPGAAVVEAYGPQHSVAAGKLTADGGVDFVTVSSSNNQLTAYLNQGGGEFAPQPAEFLEGSGSAWVVLADFDGDGALDAAIANLRSNDVTLMLGELGGNFYPGGLYTLQSTPLALLAADLDGNSRADLLVLGSVCGAGRLQVLMAR